MIKAVITAAGKGERLLPMTKEIPKEMMPLMCKLKNQSLVMPLLQLIFEQLYDSYIKNFCMIVGRTKRSIEDHFSSDYDFLRDSNSKNNHALRNFYKKIDNSEIVWINQNIQKGFGHAVKLARNYIGNDNFMVHAGDVTILNYKIHPIIQMLKIEKEFPDTSAILLLKKVEDPRRYGVAVVSSITKSVYDVLEVEEKPMKPKSNYALMPIYFFKPEIFDCLDEIGIGKNNELQLTDAIQKLIEKNKKVRAIMLAANEKEIDVGTFDSYLYSQKIISKMTLHMKDY